MTRISVTLSIVHLHLIWYCKTLVQKVSEKRLNDNECGAYDHHAHGRKDTEHQRRYQLDGGFRGPLLGDLAALCSQGIGEYAQRLSNGSSETISLDQHGDERPCALESRASCKRLPGRDSLNSSALFEVNEQEFFAQCAMAHFEFLAYANNGLIHTQAGFEADRHQVETVGKAKLQLMPPPIYGMGKPEVGHEESHDESD